MGGLFVGGFWERAGYAGKGGGPGKDGCPSRALPGVRAGLVAGTVF